MGRTALNQNMNRHQTRSVAGVRVDNTTLSDILEDIEKRLEKSGVEQRTILPICTINPEFVVQAQVDKTFMNIVNSSYVSVPDGFGILLYGLLNRVPFRQKITGIDLIFSLTALAAEHNYTIGFLGGKPGAATRTLRLFQEKYPSIKAWADEGPMVSDSFFTPGSLNNITRSLQKMPSISTTPDLRIAIEDLLCQTDILFVAFGAPKQEYFISNLPFSKREAHISPLVAVGVGGSFDEISGLVPPCPHWVEQAGCKWLFRLVTEPWRWRRQLRLLKFIYLTFVLQIRKMFYNATSTRKFKISNRDPESSS